MFKVLRFFQPNAFSHSIALPLLPKCPSSSWSCRHVAIRHNFNVACTFVEMLISIVEYFETFVEQFSAIFGDSNRKCTTINKLWSIHQRPYLAIVYSSKFRHLTCNILWNEVALMNRFQFGLHNDVKDLLLTMLDPTTLNQTLPKLFNVIIRFLNDFKKYIGNCHHSKKNSWPSHHPHLWHLHQRMIPCESIKHDSNHSWNKKNNNEVYTMGN